MRMRYYDAPDLTHLGNNENLFMRTYEGNPMIDKAYQLLAAKKYGGRL